MGVQEEQIEAIKLAFGLGTPPPPATPHADVDIKELGRLSARYEAGSRGSAAIGTDSTGGWSYGKYQIATKTGTMRAFLTYVQQADPAVFAQLDGAGGNQGATDHTAAFVAAWTTAAKDPSFGDLEHGFVASTHYDPQAKKLAAAGLDLGTRSRALCDVVWSVAVQHGGDANVVTSALATLVATAQETDKTHTPDEIIRSVPDSALIDAIYDERCCRVDKDGTSVMKYFSRSTDAVQKAVTARFDDERRMAKQELQEDGAA